MTFEPAGQQTGILEPEIGYSIVQPAAQVQAHGELFVIFGEKKEHSAKKELKPQQEQLIAQKSAPMQMEIDASQVKRGTKKNTLSVGNLQKMEASLEPELLNLVSASERKRSRHRTKSHKRSANK